MMYNIINNKRCQVLKLTNVGFIVSAYGFHSSYAESVLNFNRDSGLRNKYTAARCYHLSLDLFVYNLLCFR